MNVVGVGVVFARGRGIGALEEALTQGWVPPAKSPAHVCEILRADVFEDLNYILEDED